VLHGVGNSPQSVIESFAAGFGSANQRGKLREMKMDSEAVASAQPAMPGPPIVCSAERESTFGHYAITFH
jgi:hypothetical protein